MERSRRRFEKVREHVDLHTGVVNGEFNAWDEFDGVPGGCFTRLMNARKGVVIGEGERRQAERGGLRNDHLGRVRPVGRRRVDVEVDRHDVS